MKLLLVEDDENKRAQLVSFISSQIGAGSVSVAGSYRGGLAKLLAEKFDLVLLDMTMPTYEISGDEEGGRPRAFAGRDILRQMDRRSVVIPVIVVTQFDRFGERAEMRTRAELDAELAKAHPSNYKGMVYYNAAQEGWKEELARKIGEIQGMVAQ